MCIIRMLKNDLSSEIITILFCQININSSQRIGTFDISLLFSSLRTNKRSKVFSFLLVSFALFFELNYKDCHRIVKKRFKCKKRQKPTSSMWLHSHVACVRFLRFTPSFYVDGPWSVRLSLARPVSRRLGLDARRHGKNVARCLFEAWTSLIPRYSLKSSHTGLYMLAGFLVSASWLHM
jgi:hypothetical protein